MSPVTRKEFYLKLLPVLLIWLAFKHHSCKYSRPITGEMKSKMMIRTEHVGYMEWIVNVHRASNKKSQGDKRIWRPSYRCVDNIKV